jgi:hypothetical protein
MRRLQESVHRIKWDRIVLRHENLWGIAPYINLGIRRRWLASFTFLAALLPSENPPVPIWWKAGWAPEPVWTLWWWEKSLAPTRNGNPFLCFQARSLLTTLTELSTPPVAFCNIWVLYYRELCSCVQEIFGSKLDTDTDRTKTGFPMFSSAPAGKYWDGIWIKSRTLPSKSFPSHQSFHQ